MKKNRKFRRFIYALLLSVPLVTITGCQDDLFYPQDSENEGNSLEEAIEWYKSQKKGDEVLLSESVRTKSGEEILFYTEPSWKYYYESEDERCRALDVVLTDRIGLDFVSLSNCLVYEKTKRHCFRRSYTRLVILKSKTSGEQLGFTMTLLPSVSYILKYGDRINKITYLNRDNHFDGVIFYHNLDGTYAGGWRYENGEVTGWLPELLPEDEAGEAAANGKEVFFYQMMPATYSIKGIGQTRTSAEGGPTIDGGELGEVIVPGTGGSSGGSGGGSIIIIGGGNGNYPGDNISDNKPIDGSTGNNPKPDPEPKVDIDESVKKDSRVNAILEKLLDFPESYLKKLIARYQGGPNFNLTFKIDDSKFVGDRSTSNGVCYYGKEGAIIYLKPSYLEAAKAIEVARTILHEGLHAYINSIEYNTNPNLALNSFDKAWESFLKQPNTHHEAMAMREIENMAQELERIHKTTSEYKKGWVENAVDVKPEDRIWYYKALVWQGLNKTETYKKVSVEDKGKMESIYSQVRYLWTREWK